MENFSIWLETQAPLHIIRQLRIWENFYPLDSEAYDTLFNAELKRLMSGIEDPVEAGKLKKLLEFKWTNYIRVSVRRAGVAQGGDRDVDQIVHDICTKLMLGSLFAYDPNRHGPFDQRFKVSVANAIRNVAQKQGTRRRHFPTVSIFNEPGSIPPDEIASPAQSANERSMRGFRDFVSNRVGDLGVEVLRLRLTGGDVKNLINSETGVTSYKVKETVKAIKQLAREFAEKQGDAELVWKIDRLMNAEQETFKRRFAAT